MNIYIANLDSTIGNEELSKIFSAYGEVSSAQIAMDVFTGQSRGFGYVQMEQEEEARNAIKELHQSVLHTLTITVEEAPAPTVRKGSYKVGNGAINIYRFRKN